MRGAAGGRGLLIRTLRNLENTPLGMKVDGLVVFGVKPNITVASRGPKRFIVNLMGKLRVLPGVESVTSWRSALDRGGRTTAT